MSEKQSDEIIHDSGKTNNEEAPLIPGGNDEDGDDKYYKNFRRLDIETSCLNWLIGPVVFASMFSVIASFYVLIEYTNAYFVDREYQRANLTVEDNVTTCHTDPDSLVYRTQARASSLASTWAAYYAVAGGVPAIAANMVLGSYSDAVGRKLLFAVGISGSCIRLVITAAVIYFKLDLLYLLIACFVEGCTGQYATVLQTALAYIADITKPGKQRIFGIIYIEFVFGVALSSASFSSGFLVEALGYQYTMIICAGILVVNLLFAMIVLPETLDKKYRHKDKSFFSVMKIVLKFFTVDDSSKRRWKFQIVILIHALCNLSFLPRVATETLYQLAAPFCWSPTKVGVYSAVRTVGMLVVGLGSVKVLQLFMDEISLCLLGTVSYGAAFFWTAFVTDDISYYIIISVGLFGPVATTMQRSILSHLTPPENQGAIFTAVGTIEVVTYLVSNVSTGAIYAATVARRPGLVFLVLGGYDAVCVVLLIILKFGWHMEKRRQGYGQRSGGQEITVSGKHVYNTIEREPRRHRDSDT